MAFKTLKNFAVLAIVAISLIACDTAKKKGAEDGADGSSGSADSVGPISSEPLSFAPGGSDTGGIEGLLTVRFPYDSSTLTDEARDTLAGNAAWIKKTDGVVVTVEGHCDSRGSSEYNVALGERRAKAVKDYLVNLGVNPKRLTTISYGKEKMLDYGDTEAAHAKNRRANFSPLAK